MKLPALLEGRQGRFAYGAQLCVVSIPMLVAHPPAVTASWSYLLLATLLIIVCTGMAALLAVRRFHDLGLSGWHTLLLVVPGLNLPGLLLLALLPGMQTANRWGTATAVTTRKSRFSLDEHYFMGLRYLRMGWARTVAQ